MKTNKEIVVVAQTVVLKVYKNTKSEEITFLISQ